MNNPNEFYEDKNIKKLKKVNNRDYFKILSTEREKKNCQFSVDKVERNFRPDKLFILCGIKKVPNVNVNR